jgi:hypothetical protein
MVSDSRTLALYNYINGSQLDNLFAQTPPVAGERSPTVQNQPSLIPAKRERGLEFASARR